MPANYYTKLKVLDLSQPNAYSGQSTCIAMAVNDPNIQEIHQRLEAKGDPGDPQVMAEVIREFTVDYELHLDASLNEVKSWLQQGDFLIVHGWFTPEGRVICLAGVEIDAENNRYKLQVQDPWGEFHAPSWKYDNPNVRFYDGYYSSYSVYAACVASTSCEDAARIYKKGELDSSIKKMWVHRFMTKSSTPSLQSTGGGGSPAPSKSVSSPQSKTASAIEQAFEPLLNLITLGEGGPDAMNQGTMGNQIVSSTLDSRTVIGVKLTDLTLKQLIERQDYEMDTKNPQINDYGVFAAGKFQFIPSTLKSLVTSSGISQNTMFDVSTQNFLAVELIRTSATTAYRYVQGQSDDLDAAMNELALEWASLPTTSGGTAYPGTGNAASHEIDSVRQVLKEARAKFLAKSGTSSKKSSSSKSKTPKEIEKAFEPLLNLITLGEGGPDAMNQGTMNNKIVSSTLDSRTVIGVKLTDLTLKQLIDRQDYEMDTKNPQINDYGVFAAGKFQFIPSTLKRLFTSSGLSGSTMFDVSTQNFLAVELIRTSANSAYRYVQGESDDWKAALNELALEWASLPTTSGGTAYPGTGNAASHEIDSVRQALDDSRARYLA